MWGLVQGGAEGAWGDGGRGGCHAGGASAVEVGGEAVGEVEGKALESPLEGSGGVMGLAEALGAMGAERGPFAVGVGEDAWGVLEEVGAGEVSGGGGSGRG